MPLRSNRWLASVALGAVLGVVSANADFSTLSWGEVPLVASDDLSASCNESGDNSSCCLADTAKESFLDPVVGPPEPPLAPEPVPVPVDPPVETPSIPSTLD